MSRNPVRGRQGWLPALMMTAKGVGMEGLTDYEKQDEWEYENRRELAVQQWAVSEKTPEMQMACSAIMGHEHNVFEFPDCAMCGKENLVPDNFRDRASRREFEISRMCQECQDEVFGE